MMLACYWRDLLRIQYFIILVILLGLLEKIFYYSEYQHVDTEGYSTKSMYAIINISRQMACPLIICWPMAVSTVILVTRYKYQIRSFEGRPTRDKLAIDVIFIHQYENVQVQPIVSLHIGIIQPGSELRYRYLIYVTLCRDKVIIESNMLASDIPVTQLCLYERGQLHCFISHDFPLF